ncbi:hypothetical protein FGB62_69g291 [Gracilaria domingensis]|nr:hypothetical protein FGB62_69g291 [Gracilaria domingensis]
MGGDHNGGLLQGHGRNNNRRMALDLLQHNVGIDKAGGKKVLDLLRRAAGANDMAGEIGGVLGAIARNKVAKVARISGKSAVGIDLAAEVGEDGRARPAAALELAVRRGRHGGRGERGGGRLRGLVGGHLHGGGLGRAGGGGVGGGGASAVGRVARGALKGGGGGGGGRAWVGKMGARLEGVHAVAARGGTPCSRSTPRGADQSRSHVRAWRWLTRPSAAGALAAAAAAPPPRAQRCKRRGGRSPAAAAAAARGAASGGARGGVRRRAAGGMRARAPLETARRGGARGAAALRRARAAQARRSFHTDMRARARAAAAAARRG